VAQSEIEWDVSANTSRVIRILLITQFALIGGIVLLTGASLLLAVAGRYATGTTIFEFIGMAILIITVPILVFWAVLRVLTGSGIKRAIALYFLYDPAHPERTVFDHAHPRQYVAAAAVGFFGYLGAIYVFEFQSGNVLLFALVGALFCSFLWYTMPNRGHLDTESETLTIYNRRTITEGGRFSAWNAARGFSDDDRQTSLKDAIGMRAIQIDDIVILALRHRSGYAPTLVVVPPHVAERFAQEYGG